jgi:hypothetical protein
MVGLAVFLILSVVAVTNLAAVAGFPWSFKFSSWLQEAFGMTDHGGLWGFLQIAASFENRVGAGLTAIALRV